MPPLLSQPIVKEEPLADRLHKMMGSQPFRPANMPGSTQAVSDGFTRDMPVQKVGMDVLSKFPFAQQAKDTLKDTKYRGVAEGQTINGKDAVQGEFRKRGTDIFEYVNGRLVLRPLGENREKLATWVADKLGAFDAPDITMRKDTDRPEEVMAHEMIHRLFEETPMGGKQSEADGRAGVSWITTWDRIKKADQDMGPLLSGIDQHLMKVADPENPYSIANERFAYLGQMALYNGIDAIPKELQHYYYGIIDGAPEPTPEQLGSALDPSAGFEMDVASSYGDDPMSTGEGATDGPINRTTLADKIYGLLTGASVSRIENPNAGNFSGEKKVNALPPEEKKTILGVLFGEVSNRSPEKQALEAQTILNTARNRAEARGTTILDELMRPNQYQAFGGKEFNRFVSGEIKETDKQKLESISKIVEQLEAGTLEDNIDGAQYYIHRPDGSIVATKEYLYGKNKQSTASAINAI